MTKRIITFAVVGAVALVAAGCASRVDSRGSQLDPDRIKEIKPGEQTRNVVAEILGSPSSVTPFGSDTWYYISKRTETFAFLEPEVKERQVVVIRFGKDGKVAAVDTKGVEAGKAIEPVGRTTPTHGNKMTVLEQLIGNLGRFRNKNEARAERRRRDEEDGIFSDPEDINRGY